MPAMRRQSAAGRQQRGELQSKGRRRLLIHIVRWRLTAALAVAARQRMNAETQHDMVATAQERHGTVLHTDAVQTAGKLPRRLAEFGADLVTFSAHKLCGPKGAAGAP